MTTQPKPSTSSTANRDQLQTLLAGEPAEMEFRVEISPRLQVSFTLSPTLVWGKWLEALARHGRDLTEAIEGDIPVDVNFRVSAQEVGKLVDTPEQQVGEVVEWCAIWGRRPAALLVEYLGSTVFTRRKRRLWHEWQRRPSHRAADHRDRGLGVLALLAQSG